MKEKKRIPIDTQIPDLETPWDNGTNAYTGARVEELLKSKLTEALAEKQDRISAITEVNTALETGLNTEKTARETADNTLQANIEAETQARTSAITAVNTAIETAISTEQGLRSSKDTELETAISTETTNRETADNALQENINSKGIVWDSALNIKSGALVSYNDVLYKALRDISAGGANPYNNSDYVRLTQSGYLMMTEEQFELARENNALDENILYLIEEEE